MADRSQSSRDPPDGGWGWVIVMATFITFALTAGSMYSFGVLYVAFLDAFGESKSKTAWVGSIFTFLFALTSSLGVALARKIGHQKTVMLGGFLVFIGLFTSSFANHLVVLFFTYGIITASGYPQFVNVPPKGTYSLYGYMMDMYWLWIGIYGQPRNRESVFQEKADHCSRNIVCWEWCRSVCIIFGNSIFTGYLGWRGTLLLLSAIAFNTCVAGALLWPLNEGKNSYPEKSDISEEENEENVNLNTEEFIQGTYVNGTKSTKTSCILRCIKNCVTAPLDLSLFLEPVYWVQICIAIGQAFVNGTILIHMVRRSREYGISDYYSSLIPAVMGLTQVITRPLWGAIGHIRGLRPNILYGIALAVCGVNTIVSTYTRTFTGQAVFIIIIFGICNGGYTIFMPLVVSSFLGPSKIGFGTSFLLQVCGLTTLLVSPLAGWIRDETGVYDWAFWMAGISVLLAAVLAFLLPVIEKVVKRKRHRKAEYREETNITDLY
ncbi:monocarboxylate transporter 12-like [Glandiceps talaboti]